MKSIIAKNQATGETVNTTVETVNTVLRRKGSSVLPGQPVISLLPETFSALLDQIALENNENE